jgi:hypothetical protein
LKFRFRHIIAFVLLAVGAGLLVWFFIAGDDEDGFQLPQQSADQLTSDEDEVHQQGVGADTRASVGDGTSGEVAEDTIRGQVVRPNGEPASGVRVVIQSPGLEEPREVVTGRGGMFSASDLPRRMYAVEASAPNFGPAIVIGVVPGGAPLRLTLSGGRSITGTVVSEGAPVSDAVIHVGSPGMFPQRSVQSGADGTFSLGGLRPGRYEYIAIREGLSSGFGGHFIINDDGTMEPSELRIVMEPSASTRLRIVDRQTGDPVDIAVATFSARPMYVLALHEIADAGEAAIEYLATDEYHLRVRAPGYLPYSQKIWIGPSSRHTIELSRGAQICGTIQTEAGNAVSGASIRAVIETPDRGRFELTSGIFEDFHRLARPDGAPFFWPGSNYRSSEDGSYCIGGLPSGEATVVARASGYAEGASRTLSLQKDQQYDSVNIELKRGRSIRGRVEGPGGEPVMGATVIATSANLPLWISGNTQITDRSGIFRFDNLTRDIRIRVRHPQHGVHDEQVSVPEEGIDDLVIQLTDESSMSVEGRVLSTQSGPAVGANVWLMRGGASVPVCRAVTDGDGLFEATDCSAAPERILIRHDGYAPLDEELIDPAEARDWVLRSGGQLALVTGRFAADIDVEPMFNLPAAIWPRPTRSLEQWSRKIVPHVTPGRYRVTCTVEDHADASVVVDVKSDQRTEAVCPLPTQLQEFRVYVVDPQGAPVSNALVMLTGLEEPVSKLTDSAGKISVEAEPGRWVRATGIHERWGEGQTNLRTPSEAVEPYRIELGEPVGSLGEGDFVGMLENWGIDAARDRRSVVIDTIEDNSPAAGVGLRRRDLLLWARELSGSRLSIGVRRNGEIVSFELVRQSP